METKSPRNTSAYRASLRLYGDSLKRSQRKVEREIDQMKEAKEAAEAFKAGRGSEMFLKRRQEYSPIITGATILNMSDMRLTQEIASLQSQMKSWGPRSGPASTQPSTQPSPVTMPVDVLIRSPIPTPSPRPRREPIGWSELFDTIMHNNVLPN